MPFFTLEIELLEPLLSPLPSELSDVLDPKLESLAVILLTFSNVDRVGRSARLSTVEFIKCRPGIKKI